MNYYQAIKSKLEKPYIISNFIQLSKLAYKVDWCWKWQKITKEQMEELADIITEAFTYAK